jgi:hypothetical protein
MNALESLTTLRFPAVSPRSRLESFLSHFADVRAGEGVGVLLMALNLFLLLGVLPAENGSRGFDSHARRR